MSTIRKSNNLQLSKASLAASDHCTEEDHAREHLHQLREWWASLDWLVNTGQNHRRLNHDGIFCQQLIKDFKILDSEQTDLFKINIHDIEPKDLSRDEIAKQRT